MNQNIKIPFVDLYSQNKELRAEIDLAIADIIDRSDFITGPTVEKFEKAIPASRENCENPCSCQPIQRNTTSMLRYLYLCFYARSREGVSAHSTRRARAPSGAKG